MQCRMIGAIGFALAIAAATGSAWGAPGEDLEAVIEDCESCHGEGGASEHEDIPVIGGMSSFYLDAQLHAYQDEFRPCMEVEYPTGPEKGEMGDMCKEVDGLTEEDIANLADYFADKPFVVPDQEVDAALAAQGEKLHNAHCSKCHSEGGGLDFDDAGILAGQWRPYLRQTFREYLAHERWQPEKMTPKMDQLSEDDVDALIEYYVSQEPVQ